MATLAASPDNRSEKEVGVAYDDKGRSQHRALVILFGHRVALETPVHVRLLLHCIECVAA